MPSKKSGDNPELANHEIVTLSVYLLGGLTKPVDTEDVAIKAHELAPGRFAWRKHPLQVSLDAVRKRLWDAKSEARGFLYVVGSETDGWLLTEKGLLFVQGYLANNPNGFEGCAVTIRRNAAENRWYRSERSRLLTTEAYLKFTHGKKDEITQREANAFFRLDEYVAKPAQSRKINRILTTFRDDPEFVDLLPILVRLVGEQSNG